MLNILSPKALQALINELKELFMEAVKIATKTNEGRLKSRKDAAKYIGLSVDILDKLAKQGMITPVKFDGVNKILYDVRDLDELIELNKLENKYSGVA